MMIRALHHLSYGDRELGAAQPGEETLRRAYCGLPLSDVGYKKAGGGTS